MDCYRRLSFVSSELLNFLTFHFPLSDFNGRVQISCRGRRSSALLPALTCSISEISDRVTAFFFSHFSDYYITANTFSGVRRISEDIFSLNNIVIDIDCHIEEIDFDLEFYLESFILSLDDNLFGVELPTPSSIVFTGRGLQIWWAFDAISSRFLNFYKEIVDFYIKNIQELIDNSVFDDFSCFSVDAPASRNVIGYFRCPFTFNTKANVQSRAIVYGHRYVLMDLFDMMKKEKNDSEDLPYRKNKETVATSVVNYGHFSEIANNRMSVIYYLRELRNNAIGEEERNNLCFMLYNSLVTTLGHDIAFSEVERFNNGFKSPMTKGELDSSTSSARTKGGYQYSNEKFLKFLGISEDEANCVGFMGENSPSKLSKKQITSFQSKNKKIERNKKVLEFFDDGLSSTEISKKMNVSMPTIAKILKDNARSKEKVNDEQIQSLINQGVNFTDIAKKCGCSVRTIQRKAKV